MQNEVENTQYLERQRKGRWVLLSMLIFFVAPIVAVIAMYKFDWRPQGRSVGELITPAYLLQMPNLVKRSDGKQIGAELWKDKWSMVYVAEQCEEKCLEKLRNMRQIHVSLYKEIPRMQRVLITSQTDVAELKQMHPELIVLNQPVEVVEQLNAQFDETGVQASHADKLYLVDPRGFLMMRYASDTDPALIRKDIVRLMKYSWAG
ncbi:MAG TPA: hypothetical protein PL131_05730 [Methylotenera sp.]|nr:hypothetical protein [Methylotenera sp.]HPH05355.1 hypothetical protein [Methylotenera sp.]HPN01281.1 hypothetical protein [Methylotenera sp.]